MGFKKTKKTSPLIPHKGLGAWTQPEAERNSFYVFITKQTLFLPQLKHYLTFASKAAINNLLSALSVKDRTARFWACGLKRSILVSSWIFLCELHLQIKLPNGQIVSLLWSLHCLTGSGALTIQHFRAVLWSLHIVVRPIRSKQLSDAF